MNKFMRTLTIMTMIVVPLLLIIIGVVLNTIPWIYTIAILIACSIDIVVNCNFGDIEDTIDDVTKASCFLYCLFITLISQIGLIYYFVSNRTNIFDYISLVIIFACNANIFYSAYKAYKKMKEGK